MNNCPAVHTVTYENHARPVRFSMLWHQCSIWSCSNKEESCPADIYGQLHCKCPELCGKGCTLSSTILSLHSIGKMPQKVYLIIMQKTSQTYMNPHWAQWKPGPEAYMYNIHYNEFKGPSLMNSFILPTSF